MILCPPSLYHKLRIYGPHHFQVRCVSVDGGRSAIWWQIVHHSACIDVSCREPVVYGDSLHSEWDTLCSTHCTNTQSPISAQCHGDNGRVSVDTPIERNKSPDIGSRTRLLVWYTIKCHKWNKRTFSGNFWEKIEGELL